MPSCSLWEKAMSEVSDGYARLGWKAKAGIWFAAIIAVALIVLILFRLMFVNFIDNYQLGYKFDSRTGEISVLDGPGYVVTPPFVVSIHTVDLRPMQVCINANSRVLNCKLVQFNKDGLRTFLEWHGRNDYDGSSSVGGGLNDILKSYAYDGFGRSYPFLTILKELKPEDIPAVPK